MVRASPTVILAFLAALLGAVTAVPNFTVCAIPVGSGALVSEYVLQYYAPLYPQYNWQFKFLMGKLTGTTVRNAVSAWLTNGTTCNAMVGYGFSSVDIALSPLVSVPWVDWSATSTELSDKSSHPTFARTVPTDGIAAKMVISALKHFGWKQVNVFCVDDPFGRSVATGVTQAMTAIGGVVEVSRCVSADPDPSLVFSIIDELRAAKSRAVYIATNTNLNAWSLFRDRILNNSWQNDFTLMFNDQCASASGDYYLFPGALCASYAIDTNVSTPFVTAYQARDYSAISAQVGSLGYNTSTVSWTKCSSVFDFMALDGALLLMNAVATYNSSNASQGTIYQYMRNTPVVGTTGIVKLDANGDRPDANAIIYNVIPGGTQQAVGTVSSSVFYPSALAQSTGVYAWGSFNNVDAMPSVIRPVVTTSTLDSGIIVGAVLGGCALLLPIAWLVHRRWGTRLAPKNANAPVAIMFCGLKGLAAMQDRYPRDAPKVQDKFISLVRSAISRTACYEAKKMGTTFLIVSSNPAKLLECADHVQAAMGNIKWSAILGAKNAAAAADGRSRQDSTATGATTANNLKPKASTLSDRSSVASSYAAADGFSIAACVGLNYEKVRIDFDETHRVYEYSGTGVDDTAALSDQCPKGRIVGSAHFAAEIGDTSAFLKFKKIAFSAKREGEVLLRRVGAAVVQMGDGMESEVDSQVTDDENAAESFAAALQEAVSGVAMKKITVCHVHIRELDITAPDFAATFLRIMRLADKCAADSKGHLEAAAGQDLVFTFNATQAVASQCKKAVLCMHQFLNELGKELQLRDAVCGIATGSARVGKLMGRSIVAGACVEEARGFAHRALELNQRYSKSADEAEAQTTIRMVASSIIADEISTACVYQFVGVQTTGAGRTVGIVAVMGLHAGSASDEWMYEMQEAESANPYAAANTAWACYLAGRKKDAEEHLSRLLAGDPTIKTACRASTDALSVLLTTAP